MGRLIRDYDNYDDAIKPRIEDALNVAAKVGIGLIPGAGPFLSALIEFIITNPGQERANTYFRDLEAQLTDLQEKGLVTMEDLKSNEHFFNVIINAIPKALNSIESEKRRAFRNAILNTAVGQNPDETKIHMFLRQLDALTISHIKLLHLFSDPRKWFTTYGRPIPQTSSLNSLLTNAFPELKGQEDLVRLLWSDLKTAGFHNSGELMGNMTSDGTLSPRVSQLGLEFIDFITFDDRI